MGAGCFEDLKMHIGHDVCVVYYGDEDNPVNVAVECETCHCVLFDYTREEDSIDAPRFKGRRVDIRAILAEESSRKELMQFMEESIKGVIKMGGGLHEVGRIDSSVFLDVGEPSCDPDIPEDECPVCNDVTPEHATIIEDTFVDFIRRLEFPNLPEGDLEAKGIISARVHMLGEPTSDGQTTFLIEKALMMVGPATVIPAANRTLPQAVKLEQAAAHRCFMNSDIPEAKEQAQEHSQLALWLQELLDLRSAMASYTCCVRDIANGCIEQPVQWCTDFLKHEGYSEEEIKGEEEEDDG